MRNHISRHFDALAYAYFWLSASLLAVLVERPGPCAVGLGTVAPFVVAYVLRSRRSAG